MQINVNSNGVFKPINIVIRCETFDDFNTLLKLSELEQPESKPELKTFLYNFKLYLLKYYKEIND